MTLYHMVNQTITSRAASSRVMVCISASSLSTQLINEAHLMAADLHTEWIAVYVETPKRFPKGEKERIQIARHLQFAEGLGAQAVSIPGNDVAQEVLALAKRHNVIRIVLGQPRHSRLFELFHGSVVNAIIRYSQGIDVHVISGKAEDKSHQEKSIRLGITRRVFLQPYLTVTLIVSVLTALLHGIGPFSNLVNIALLYLFPVLFSAVRWGLSPSLYAAVLGLLAFDFFFVPPFYSFAVSDLRYVISFVVFLTVATLTASLASKLQQQLYSAKQRETVTATLFALSRQITAIGDLHSVLDSIARQVSETVSSQAAIFLPDNKGDLELAAVSGAESNWLQSNSDLVIVQWVYTHGDTAGHGTKTLGENANIYIPLRTENQVHGVLVVKLEPNTDKLEPIEERMRVVEALASLAAVAISRIKLEEEAKVAHVAAESERLRTALFDSISHELRTPLAAILGSVTGILAGEGVFGPEEKRDLLLTIREGAMRMNRLITNFLEMVRLESGMLRLNKNWCDLEDMIGVALSQLKDALQFRDVKVVLDERIPPIAVDEVLMEQVLVNVLNNAVKYSPEGSDIGISARLEEGRVCMMIADQGPGVAMAESEQIFEKFYRSVNLKHIPGTGLGLAICKGIVEAHGGVIRAQPNADKGTIIKICIPVSDEAASFFPSHEIVTKAGEQLNGSWAKNINRGR